MLGFVCAMEIEAKGLLELMTDKKEVNVGNLKFTQGKVLGKDAVITVCGVGKVFAAMYSQAMIIKFAPEIIVNFGVAGALSPNLKQGDVVVASSVVQHDVDTTALGDLKGQLTSLKKINFPCDKEATEFFANLCKELKIKRERYPVASGDTFISDENQKEFLNKWFGASACDMEAGAIGQVCYIAGVPFASIKAISDCADGSAPESFETFAEKGSKIVTDLVCKYIEQK